MEIVWVVIVLVFLFVFIYISFRNRLINLKNKIEYANGSVDAMLRQRYDLIPNLVTIVKEYMKYEKKLMEKLTELRSQSQNPSLSEKQKIDLNNHIDRSFNTFNLTVENYPQLKANEQFLKLQATLNECEGQLAAARRTYNAAVMHYNNAIEIFPSNIIASQMGYKTKNMFLADLNRN